MNDAARLTSEPDVSRATDREDCGREAAALCTLVAAAVIIAVGEGPGLCCGDLTLRRLSFALLTCNAQYYMTGGPCLPLPCVQARILASNVPVVADRGGSNC